MTSVVKDNARDIFETVVQQKGLKKSFIAKKIGMSPQNLTNIIHRRRINADFVFKVSKVLEVDPSIFIKKAYTENLGRKKNE